MIADRAKLLEKIWNAPVSGNILNLVEGERIVGENMGELLRTNGERTPCETPQLLQLLQAKKLGKGAYGSVSKVTVDNYAFVVKESGYPDEVKLHASAVDNPSIVNNVEPQVLELLNDKVLLEDRTPHLPLYGGFFHCDSKASYLLLEYADGSLTDILSLDNLRVLVFQIIWTLAAVQEAFPGFRHNDLHIGNILYMNSGKKGYDLYQSGEQNFYLPQVGYSIVLSDFGLSNISGLVTNYDAIKQEYDNTGMGTTINRYADGFRIMNFIYDLLQRAKRSDLAFEAFYRRNFLPPKGLMDERYLTIKNDVEYRIMRDVLNDEYFAEFRTKQPTVNAYHIQGKQKISSPLLYSETLNTRKSCESYDLPFYVNKNTLRKEVCINAMNLFPILNREDFDPRIISHLARLTLRGIGVGNLTHSCQELYSTMIGYLHLPLEFNEVFHAYILQLVLYKLLGCYVITTDDFLGLIDTIFVVAKGRKVFLYNVFQDLISQLNLVVYELDLDHQTLLPNYLEISQTLLWR